MGAAAPAQPAGDWTGAGLRHSLRGVGKGHIKGGQEPALRPPAHSGQGVCQALHPWKTRLNKSLLTPGRKGEPECPCFARVLYNPGHSQISFLGKCDKRRGLGSWAFSLGTAQEGSGLVHRQPRPRLQTCMGQCCSGSCTPLGSGSSQGPAQ